MILAVGIPCFETVQTQFAASLAMALARRDRPFDFILTTSHSSIISNARNQCVRDALDAKAEYLMFLDSDMTFPPDTIERLLAHKKDVVGATYMRKSPPHEIMARPVGGRVDARGGLVECEFIPTGVMLIDMRVLKAIRRPWFKLLTDLKLERTIGEDEFFCREARESGFEVWCDVDLSYEVEHLCQSSLRIVRELDA